MLQISSFKAPISTKVPGPLTSNMVNKRSITPSLTEDEKVAFIAGSHREKGLNLGWENMEKTGKNNPANVKKMVSGITFHDHPLFFVSPSHDGKTDALN